MATINIHNIVGMKADRSEDHAWLRIASRMDHVSLHCPYELAQLLADVFTEYTEMMQGRADQAERAEEAE
jgi:hypothetical protein